MYDAIRCSLKSYRTDGQRSLLHATGDKNNKTISLRNENQLVKSDESLVLYCSCTLTKDLMNANFFWL